MLNVRGLGGFPNEQRVSWSEIRAAFSSCEIVSHPKRVQEGWRVLKHSLGELSFYIDSRKGDFEETTCISYSDHDVIEFLNLNGIENHPIWDGLFYILSRSRTFLHINLHIAEAAVVCQPHLENELPSWLPSHALRFHCSSGNEIYRVIVSGWRSRCAAMELYNARTKWASPEEDMQALVAFKRYILQEKEPKAKLIWHGKSVALNGSIGTFLDIYGVWVDWRDYDDSIVEYFSQCMSEHKLTSEMQDDSLRIMFELESGDVRTVICELDRYATIRAINSLIEPIYEIRRVNKSLRDDTHGFLLAPAWMWRRLEDEYGEKLNGRIKKIEASDKFA